MGLLLVLLVFAAGVCTLSSILYAYEAGNTRPPPLERPVTDMARAFASGVTALTLATVAYPTGYWGGLWRSRSSDPATKPTVILIHGLYHNPSAWLVIKPALLRSGYPRVHALAYNAFGAKTFEDIASELTRQVHALLDETPRIVLVGHSMGGLFVRRLLADPRISQAAMAAVTLGAPHHGSKMAALALLGTVGRSLLPDSPLFPALAALPDPPGVPKLNVVSPADDMVLPNASCSMAGESWSEIRTPPLSHIALLYHPPTIRRVISFLDVSGGAG